MTSSATLYSKVSSPQAADGLKLIDRLSPLKDSHVLDLGCGTGYLASVLAELVGPGGKVTGVDPDGERIRLAREQYGTISNLEFAEGSGDDIPSGPYDAVFSNKVLHWIKDKEPVFQKVFQNLRSGGKFAFCCSTSYPPIVSQLEALRMEPTETPKHKGVVHICPPEVYETIASKCGFRMDYKMFELRKFEFPNVTALLEWTCASSGGKVDYHSISSTALDETFGDEPVSFDVNEVTLLCISEGIVSTWISIKYESKHDGFAIRLRTVFAY